MGGEKRESRGGKERERRKEIYMERSSLIVGLQIFPKGKDRRTTKQLFPFIMQAITGNLFWPVKLLILSWLLSNLSSKFNVKTGDCVITNLGTEIESLLFLPEERRGGLFRFFFFFPFLSIDLTAKRLFITSP